ncbi:hypothetical protein BCR39DRAFT_561571 [Naematelia encephala]|uniref:DUF1479-domain-containing protein n=1 Tax=Naematelia encephala TaxID=71784 RepID=A0A1Y2AR18_9TREE|nr:hypothetical protein BCR39DRAFT_561571 [Naematelia encephala]
MTPPPLPPTPRRKERKEGDIGSVFASLSGEAEAVLPPRFLDLKRSIIGDEANQAALRKGWASLTRRLAQRADEIEAKQQAAITYEEFIERPSKQLIDEIKSCGTVVVRNVVSEEQALKWLDEIREYVKLNPQVKGFPADDKQVFELYWSKPQLAARAHPRSMAVQRALLSLFSRSPDTPVSLETPLTYADRLRIRNPGDAKFALGPHIDGGSIERWEDPTYRSVYERILRGKWEEFDAWEIGARGEAKQNMYDGAGACGVFRAFQGWTSLSDTGPTEGTLRVYPFIQEMSAYTLMRPLFKVIQSRAELSHDAYLAPGNWELDLETSRFPGSPLARGQELNDDTHPHLALSRTMVSLPRVKPGDQAWWHCDVIHAVEAEHRGTGPSAVMYIPSVPLTAQNAEYVRDQRESFLAARPPPDFPGGVGESGFQGTGREEDVVGLAARNAMGLDAFDFHEGLSDDERAIREKDERAIREKANVVLGI